MVYSNDDQIHCAYHVKQRMELQEARVEAVCEMQPGVEEPAKSTDSSSSQCNARRCSSRCPGEEVTEDFDKSPVEVCPATPTGYCSSDPDKATDCPGACRTTACSCCPSNSTYCCGQCPPDLRLWTVLYAVLTACIMAFLVGTTLAYSSPALLELAQLQDAEFRFDTRLSDIFGASSLVGAIFGGPIAGYIADKWGRKTSLALNSVPYLIGYFIILASYLVRDGVAFKVVLMVGRFITGVGMGWAYIVVPVYIGEITPTELRSMLGTFSELSLTCGILLLYGLGSIPGFHYYDLALVHIVVLTLFMFMVVWIPETPRWLLFKLRDEKRAIAVLKYLRGPENQSRIRKELKGIQSSIPEKELATHQQLRLIFCDRSTLVPFLLITFLYMFQQLCGGGSTIVSYAGQIFLAAGAPNPDVTSTYTVGGSLVLMTILVSLLVERVGRKILLAISAAGMFTGSMLLGIHIYFTRPEFCSDSNSTLIDTMMGINEIGQEDMITVMSASCNPHLFPLAITSVIVFVLSFSVGLGPIPWVMLSEYLPLQVRGLAGGLVVACHWVAGVLVTGAFLSYSELVGGPFAWWTLAMMNLVGLVVIVTFMVETKGKTLEETGELFKNNPCQVCSSFRPSRHYIRHYIIK